MKPSKCQQFFHTFSIAPPVGRGQVPKGAGTTKCVQTSHCVIANPVRTLGVAISCRHSQKSPHPCRAGICPRRSTYDRICSIINPCGCRLCGLRRHVPSPTRAAANYGGSLRGKRNSERHIDTPFAVYNSLFPIPYTPSYYSYRFKNAFHAFKGIGRLHIAGQDILLGRLAR